MVSVFFFLIPIFQSYTKIYLQLESCIWDLFQNNVLVGEDRDTDGTEVNRTDGFGAPVCAILST